MKSDGRKSCGARIIWAITEKGKAMPVDAKAEARITLEPALLPDARPDVRFVRTHTSHFATCPNAAGHRATGAPDR